MSKRQGSLVIGLRIALAALIVLLGGVACVNGGAAQPPSPSPSVPRGDPVPAQLDGAWIQVADPSIVLILTGTYYSSAGPALVGSSTHGNLAVNGSEIDFYNGSLCHTPLPGGIGQYRWTISAGLLTFSPLNSDPCPRAPYWADPKGWQRPA